MAKGSTLVISSIRGGMNDQDPQQALADDQAVLLENVEFFFSTLGERRKGCTQVSITSSGLNSSDHMVHLNIHFPQLAEIYESELFAVSATNGASLHFARRDKSGVWHPFTISTGDSVDTTFPAALRIHSQTLHGKMFFVLHTDQDRIYVYDSLGVFRRAGLAAPLTAPTAVNTAVPGTYTLDRFFRVRYIEKNGAEILRRSEPSPELDFTPNGIDNGAIVTRPALVNEGETHWELEASSGDGNWYVIATLAVGTTTYTDTTQPVTDYASGTLSEDIGEYDLAFGAKYVKADQDRLIIAGHWTDAKKGSRVAWSPAWKNLGVGNDERIPADTDNFFDLDWMDGGELTGISDPVNGVFYAFKWNRIYKIQRTGQFDKAYDNFLLSSDRGAIYGSIVSGTDEFGRGCVYFIDPSIGPMRVGAQGLQHIQNIRTTWRHVNTKAANIAVHGVYYPDKLQIHWWVATDGADSPNKKIILQVNEVRTSQVEGGTERGWTTATGTLTTAWCSTTVPENVRDEETLELRLTFRPYVGFPTPQYLAVSDTGNDDMGDSYRGIIRTKPYIVTNLLDRFGARTAALLATANDDPTCLINVKFIRDFGIEDNLTTTNFVPETHETYVIKVLDNLVMSSDRAIQVEFSDP